MGSEAVGYDTGKQIKGRKVISRNICTRSEVSTPPNLPLARGGAVGGGVTLVFSYLEIA